MNLSSHPSPFTTAVPSISSSRSAALQCLLRAEHRLSSEKAALFSRNAPPMEHHARLAPFRGEMAEALQSYYRSQSWAEIENPVRSFPLPLGQEPNIRDVWL